MATMEGTRTSTRKKDTRPKSTSRSNLNKEDLATLKELESSQGIMIDRTNTTKTAKTVSFTDLNNTPKWDDEDSLSEINIPLVDTPRSSQSNQEQTQIITTGNQIAIPYPISPSIIVQNHTTTTEPETPKTTRLTETRSDINIVHNPTHNTTPLTVDAVTSEIILQIQPTPFIQEETLELFRPNTYPLQKFIILRNLLGKIVRTHYHIINLEDNLQQGTVPPAMRANRETQVIDPDTSYQLSMLQINGEYEEKILQTTLTHYRRLKPKLVNDFSNLWDNKAGVNEKENKLIRLKLIHYKNTMIKEKTEAIDRRKNIREQRRKERTENQTPPQDTTQPTTTTGWNNNTRPLPQRQPWRRTRYPENPNRNQRNNQGNPTNQPLPNQQ